MNESTVTPASTQLAGLRNQGVGLCVLVVDDDPDMRSSLRRVLELDGYEVDLVASQAELLAVDDLPRYFAILLDLKLPDGHASELFDHLRQTAPDAAVLVVTGHADMDSTLRALRKGVDDYLIKPIEPDTLRSRLSSLAELYRIRRELRESESRMRFLVEYMPAGAVHVDHDRVFFNRAAEAFTGYRNDEIMTLEDWFQVLVRRDPEIHRQRYDRAKSEGFRSAFVLPIRRKDGVDREIEIAGYRYDHQEIWIINDKTELLEAQRKLVQSERLAAIGEMCTGLAHESRNALQRARGCLDLLELDLEGNPEQLDLVVRIRRSLADLQRNYEEVKQYAAPINLVIESVDLVQLIRLAFEDATIDRPRDRHHLVVDAPGPAILRADAHRLRQLFRNLLDNALAASSDDDEIVVSIRPSVEDGDDHWGIRVHDDGIGMSPEMLRQSFEPFYTTKQHGTGLGLAICRRIVHAHNGTISIDSEWGNGTTVQVRLPRCNTEGHAPHDTPR